MSYVDWNDGYAGTLWAQWMVKALHGKGNVIYTGGPAGNPVGASQLAAVVAVFKKYPGMKLLTGTKDWPVTNWDPATAQKVTAALLAKYVSRAKRAGVPPELLTAAVPDGAPAAVVAAYLAGGDPEGELRAAATALGERLRAVEASLPTPTDGEPRRTSPEDWRTHWE